MRKFILPALCMAFIQLSTPGYSQTPIGGTATVGPDQDYETFADAIVDLQENGIAEGGLILQALPITYNENIVISEIDGLGPDSRLTIAGDESATTTISGNGTAAGSEAVVRLTGTSYVTLENLRIVDGSTGDGEAVEWGIHFQGTADAGCRHNEVSSCRIFMGPAGGETTNLTRGIRSTSAATEPETSNSFNTIANTSIDNVGWGIQWSANANFFGSLIQSDSANSVINCIFGSERRIGHAQSSAAIGMNFAGNRDLLLFNNLVDSVLNTDSEPTLPISNSAFSFDNCSGELSFNRVNFVRYEGTIGSAYGIRASILEGDTLLIKNNFISNVSRSNFTGSTTDPSFSTAGIWIFAQAGGGGLARVLHNTIFLENDEAVSYRSVGFHLSGGSSGQFDADLINNIIINNFSTTGPEYSAYAVADGNSTPGFLTADYNNLVAEGVNGFVGVIGQELGGVNIELEDIDSWIETSETGANQVSFPVLFEDETTGNLRLIDDAELLTTIFCPPLPEVPQDIDFELRNDEFTHMGAHEGSITLSILGVERSVDLPIFPNPATTEVNFQIADEFPDFYNVRIVDVNGRVMIENARQIITETDVNRFDVSKLAPGVYILQVFTDEQNFVGKFIKD